MNCLLFVHTSYKDHELAVVWYLHVPYVKSDFLFDLPVAMAV